MNLKYPTGATELNTEEQEQLISKHLTTQSELNEWEFQNISMAKNWIINYKGEVLDEKFLKTLHKKMFDQTWKWAGNYRTSSKNIGVDAYKIPTELRNLLDDIKYQIEKNSNTKKRIAAIFHHRLVKIHLFPNGNGRHAREACNKLLKTLELDPFLWGKTNLVEECTIRKKYIQALLSADKGGLQSSIYIFENIIES